MIKSGFKLIALLLWALILLLMLCGTGFQRGALRVSLTESTRAKFLLYTGSQVEITAPKTLAQTFTANYPGLSQIEILFVGQPDPQPVLFSLKAACDAPEVILSRQVNLPPVDGLAYYPFTFEPLDNSAGQSYCLLLAVPEGSLQLQLSGGDLYPYGQLEINEPELEQVDLPPVPNQAEPAQDLSFRIYLPLVVSKSPGRAVSFEDIGFLLHYDAPFWPAAQVFTARLVANKPYLWGQPWFYAGLVSVYGVLLFGLFRLAWRMRAGDEEIRR